ncbi:uncharacterized protein [Ambystoma mexicanum]|uniref:uncharacterized protein n=1 Tax=Ambystoma mexicanum TaxID=8296 RepID=UPI0037E76F75
MYGVNLSCLIHSWILGLVGVTVALNGLHLDGFDDLLLPVTNVTSVPVITGILIVMNNVVPKQPYASADKPARLKTWIREMRQIHQEQVKTTLMPAVQEPFVGRRKHSHMITQEENMWIYLAQQVLNISHFCLTDVPNAEALFTTCLVAVPTPVPVLKHIFCVTHNDSLVQDSDIRQSFSVYEYCKFCQETDKKWRNLTRVITYNITQGDVCYIMTCKAQEIGKCRQIELTNQRNQTMFERRLCSRVSRKCTSVNNTMSCNHTVITASHLNHVKLPTGWLFSCGNITYIYIPANISGGPCALTRLGLMMFPLHSVITRGKRSTFESVGLSPDCDSHLHLLSEAEVLALTLSVVGVWGLAAGGYKSLMK